MAIKPFTSSTAAKFMACHASANLEAAIPGFKQPEEIITTPPVPDQISILMDMIERVTTDTSSSMAANKGTMLHAVMAVLLDYSSKSPTMYEQFVQLMDIVATYRKSRRYTMLIEQELVLDWLPNKPKTTADLILHTSSELDVFDWKFGKGQVEAEGNVQLMMYGAAALHLAPKAKVVHVHILQPGNYGSATFDRQQLEAMKAETIKHSQAILDGDVTFGVSHACTFCPASPYTKGARGSIPCPAFINSLSPGHMERKAAAVKAADDLLGEL